MATPYSIKNVVSFETGKPSYEKEISICLEANGFSFDVMTLKGEWINHGEVEFAKAMPLTEAVSMVKTTFEQNNIPRVGFADARVIVNSDTYTLVPTSLYDAANNKHYLEWMGSIGNGNEVQVCHNDTVKSEIIFTISSQMKSVFKIAIPACKIVCQADRLINKALMERSAMKSLMLVNVRKGVVDIIVYCNKKLQLANSFAATDANEIAFQVINAMKKLNLEAAPVEVLMSGAVDRPLFDAVQPYMPNLALYAGRDIKKPTLEFQHLHAHRFASSLA